MEGVEIPDGALTDGKVEALWGEDRRIGAALGRCGRRFVLWYDQLRAEWR